MEYQKIKNLLEINFESRGTYKTNNQIRFKTSMLRTSLCNYSDAYILVKRTITVANTPVTDADAINTNKKDIFKNCAPFTSCISKINNTQIDDAQYIDVVMPMYNLIEYSDNHLKRSQILFQYCRDEPAKNINNNNNIEFVDFTDANLTDLFNLKVKVTGQTGDNGTKNVEIMVPLKYLSNSWRTLEMSLINSEIAFDLNWSEKCITVAANIANQGATFSITDAKLYVPVVTLSTQDNAKLLEQLKSGFKRTINWNKYQAKVSTERVIQYLDYLIDSSFQGVNRLFVLPFENGAQRTSGKRYYIPTREIKNCNVMIDGQNFFDQPINNLITYDNIQNISTGEGDHYTTGCLLDYDYFNKYYKMIAIDLSKQQVLDADPKATQQINFTGNLEQRATIFFIIEEAKGTVLDFSQKTVKVF